MSSPLPQPPDQAPAPESSSQNATQTPAYHQPLRSTPYPRLIVSPDQRSAATPTSAVPPQPTMANSRREQQGRDLPQTVDNSTPQEQPRHFFQSYDEFCAREGLPSRQDEYRMFPGLLRRHGLATSPPGQQTPATHNRMHGAGPTPQPAHLPSRPPYIGGGFSPAAASGRRPGGPAPSWRPQDLAPQFDREARYPTYTSNYANPPSYTNRYPMNAAPPASVVNTIRHISTEFELELIRARATESMVQRVGSGAPLPEGLHEIPPYTGNPAELNESQLFFNNTLIPYLNREIAKRDAVRPGNVLKSLLNSCTQPTYEELKGDHSCYVCTEEYGANLERGAELPVKLPCGHIVGQTCLLRWLARRDACPLCRVQITVKKAEREAVGEGRAQGPGSQQGSGPQQGV